MKQEQTFESVKKDKEYIIFQRESGTELGKYEVDEKNENMVLFGNLKRNDDFGLSIASIDFGNYEIFEIEGGVIL